MIEPCPFQQEVGLECVNTTDLNNLEEFQVELTAVTTHQKSNQQRESPTAEFVHFFDQEGVNKCQVFK